MMSAVVRVLARAAAVQIEEAAAVSALRKGKGREVDLDRAQLGHPVSRRPQAPYPATPDESPSLADGTRPVNAASASPHQVGSSSSSQLPVGRQIVQDIETISSSRPARVRSEEYAGWNSPRSGLSEARTIEDGKPVESQVVGNIETIPPETSATAQEQASSNLPPSGIKTVGEPSGIQDAENTSRRQEDTAAGLEGLSDSVLRPSESSTTPPSASTSSQPVAPVLGASIRTPADPAAPDTSYIKASESLIGGVEEDDDVPVLLRASTVPSSRIGRLFHYGSLAASLSWGAASESIRRSTGTGGTGSVFMSDANVRRLVGTLGRMRGAALKLGQFMSIQDNNVLPAEIQQVLHHVQAHANYMPDWQMEKVMASELGSEWQSLFSSFDRTPIASASIGQVHKATLAGSGTPVAIKVQFPGISSSITSDLANISLLLRGSAVLPKGLYLQNTIAVMRRELEDECDYLLEADAGRRFSKFLDGDDFFVVPKVVDGATTGKVLTTEWMSGKPLSRMKHMSQETRDKIGRNILRLCLQELFHFRFMQTDPNWANFLYDSAGDKVQLVDFGASREYTKEFMDGWYKLLTAALEGDRKAMEEESRSLGYLTGDEEEVMLKAHLDSMALVASPFGYQGPYDFANQTITDSVRALIPVMLKHRLTPPPPETYSLNRKLSGAFLMCARLGAKVDCSRLWEEYAAGYQVGDAA